MISQIDLGRAYICLVSAVDHEWAARYEWKVNLDQKGKAYVCRYEKGKRIYMHREITACPPRMVVDHVNGNSLDNRRSNLRVGSKQENSHNVGGYGLISYKGVDKRYRGGKSLYRARIVLDYQQMHLGEYGTAKEAADAYDQAALLFFGPFAWLNTPINPTEKDDQYEETCQAPF